MAFDGVTIQAVVWQLQKTIVGGRIYKIYQPENDEICLVVKNRTEEGNRTDRIVISADASLPLLYVTEQVKDNPMVAPNFCMLLRKHIGNGRITDITQPDFERIVEFSIEHLDEMGDLCHKKLIVELMGKHSNIIFVDEDNEIIDSIKHVSHQISSVREVLPGRTYVIPPTQEKRNPLEIDVNYFMNHVLTKPVPVMKAIYTSLTGLSPVIAAELCYRACIEGNESTAALSMEQREELWKQFEAFRTAVTTGSFVPCIAYSGYEPKEFAAITLTSYGHEITKLASDITGVMQFEDISKVIYEYYSGKSISTRMKQKSTDLRKIVYNAIERTSKKYDLQRAQLKDTEKREKYKLYGEFITAFGYNVQPGETSLTCENYYDGTTITIPLDPEISVMENGKKYFAKYTKQKRTYEALTEQLVSSKEELEYLLSVQTSLEIANQEDDLVLIKQELIESGYIRGRVDKNKKNKNDKSKPLHYISSDGFHMYVGKNNYQNEDITFRVADGNDMWFHAKNIPGSHVIVKLEGAKELPDRTYEEAARLAAYYSSGKNAPKVDVDYTLRKNLKKPAKAKPGLVIYHTNYSMTIEPDIHGIACL